MYKKRIGKKVTSIILAATMAVGLTACGNDTTGENAVVPDTTETTAQAQGETADTAAYSVTEENGNQELTMNGQPESSYWFPSTLMEWNASEDEDLIFNVSSVPLAERADLSKLFSVNATQNKDTKIMALPIMNASTSGNAPHGLNSVDVNTFSYWQYVDTLVYWGGSSGEGLIVPPSPDVVDQGHKNGVKVLGTIFMPQTAHGGKMEWLEDLLAQNEDGSYPIVDRLIEVANTYGFDGWFMNQETEGTEEEPLNADHAKRMQEFLAEFKEKAPELELVYYDSMTVDGEMKWQNALTDKNMAYIKSEDGKAMADGMFLNFWWYSPEYLSQTTLDTSEFISQYIEENQENSSKRLLEYSKGLAEQNGIDPYDLYAGVDVQSEGYNTKVDWSLFENPEGGTYTSLGIYCPSWAYFASENMQDFWKKENTMWVNSKGDPSAELKINNDTDWKGISSYVVERTAITKLPFITNFSTGNGYSFFKNGEQISLLDWNNRSVADVLPTYRYIIDDAEGNKLNADFDVADSYYGGTSVILRGKMKQDAQSVIKLFSADLPITDKVQFTTTAKAKGAEIKLSAVVTLDDGTEVVLDGDKPVGEEWTTVTYDASALAGKTMKTLSYSLSSAQDVSGLQFRFGNITIANADEAKKSVVTNVTVLGTDFDEDAMYAGVRLKWDADVPSEYYEVYRINQDKTKSFLGVSNTTSFYINTLPRTDETNKSTFEVVPVNNMLEEGTSSQVTMDWPDNSIPKAAFAADKTLIAPGETVTFASLCSQNTKTVKWSLPGAKEESAEGTSASAVYMEEGVYNVTVTAENESGSDEKTVESYIIVSAKASEGLSLLSSGAGTEADTFVNDNEAPKFAVDGDVTKKWCATGSAPHEITLDLGAVYAVSQVAIFHAEAGGEGAGMNTKSYEILTSEDGTTWQEAVKVTKNTAGETHDSFAPANAQYVKIIINKPTQGSDSAARIYEIEVYGLKEALEK